MKIYVVGSSSTQFTNIDSIRVPFLTDVQHDNDNIDFLNPWYCEITGLYHLVNNSTDDIIGLEQYRRYFLSNDGNCRLNEQEIHSTLQEYDIICAKEHYPNVNGPCIYCWPIHNGKHEQFETFLNVLAEQDKDMESYFRTYLQGNWHIQGNLVIGQRKILSNYLDWFLDITIKYNKVEKLSNVNKRINAYLSEFFLGAWLTYNEYKLYFNKYMNAGRIID